MNGMTTGLRMLTIMHCSDIKSKTMIVKPKPLAILIIFSFVLLLVTGCEAHHPDTVMGFIFWIAFAVFASSMTHLAKNRKFYDKYVDEDELP